MNQIYLLWLSAKIIYKVQKSSSISMSRESFNISYICINSNLFTKNSYILCTINYLNQHIMTKETRTDIQIYSAIAMLLAGVALATAGLSAA